METLDFEPFHKIPRLDRSIVVTEKIDGTNATVAIFHRNTPVLPDREFLVGGVEELNVYAGSRNGWIGKKHDNYGFRAWVTKNLEELCVLGPGIHRGEWWGSGIQCGYSLKEKRFSLFNVNRFNSEMNMNLALANGKLNDGFDLSTTCLEVPVCHVVPVIARESYFDRVLIDESLELLQKKGSLASPGFFIPEGIIVYHEGANSLFKKTIEDDRPKGAR